MRSQNGHKAERRKHPRLPVVEGLIEPIDLHFDVSPNGKASKGAPKSQPAILTNLSAGGMSLLTFVEPPHAKVFDMKIGLPGLNHVPVQGKVVRVHAKGQTFNVGIQFVKISTKHQKHIDRMAVDNLDCDTRVSLRLPEACVRDCTFHSLCHKAQKAPHWPPRV